MNAPAQQQPAALSPEKADAQPNAFHAALMNGPSLEPVLGGAAFWDANTGLLWATQPARAKNHKHAAELAAAMDLGGYSMRVPEKVELLTLVDSTTHNPATYPALREHTPTDDWYITNTECAWNPSCVWVVGFSIGLVYYLNRNGTGRLRAVCGPVPRPGQ